MYTCTHIKLCAFVYIYSNIHISVICTRQNRHSFGSFCTGEKQRYWPHAPQSRLVLDLGEGNAVWPAGPELHSVALRMCCKCQD